MNLKGFHENQLEDHFHRKAGVFFFIMNTYLKAQPLVSSNNFSSEFPKLFLDTQYK